jgi:hypothetical protein
MSEMKSRAQEGGASSRHCHVAGDCYIATRKSAIFGSSGQLPPLPKRSASKFFHGATGRKVAINVEEIIDGGMDIQKALVLIQGT